MQMQSVDPESALKMYADSGDWNKCLELAGKQARPTHSLLLCEVLSLANTYSVVSLQGPKVLAKYVALYAAQLLTSGAALSALKLFLKFGTSANPQVGMQPVSKAEGV